MVRHFLDLSDFDAGTLGGILSESRRLKGARRERRGEAGPLAGRTLAMIFESASTRTRVSFEVAMRELGGETVVLSAAEMQLGRGESIADTARVLSRYVDAIMIRTLEHAKLLELAEHATVPVINGLTRRSHPCQAMADVMTIAERKGRLEGCKVAWTGDATNVLTSLIHASTRFGFRVAVASPPELAPAREVVAWARAEGADIVITRSAEEAVEGADAVVTDTWVSMGDRDVEHRHNLLKPYQVTERLMRAAAPGAIFLHCLPAHRGEEVEAAVIDGPQSAVWDEAENRLHAQKGVLSWCFGDPRA